MSLSDDWDLFVEIAKRIGANTSIGVGRYKPDSVNLNGVFITFDYSEHRAYIRFINPKNPGDFSTKPCWLDNDILTWIDTLRENV